MSSVVKTLRGGPHDKLKLKFPSKDSLPQAFYYDRESELGVYAPKAVYVRKRVQQKNRTIIVYQYEPEWRDRVAEQRRALSYDLFCELARIYNRTTI